jgi:hypothetical protein
MSRITRIAVFITALTSLLAVMSSTASAVTWTNTGATAVHATTGSQLALHISANTLACSGGTATGTAPAHSAASTYTATGTMTFTSCSIAGQAMFISCGYTLTGTNYLNGITAGALDVTCDLRLHAGTQPKLCHIAGPAPYSYTNSTGTLTLTQSSSLQFLNASPTPCLFGTGIVTLTETTFTTTAANGPILTRHA